MLLFYIILFFIIQYYRMSGSDNAQRPIDAPQAEEKETSNETLEEEAEDTVIPIVKANS